MGGKLGSSTTALEALRGADLTGKYAVVTGGNSGIGIETVRALASAGAAVTLCARDVVSGERVAADLRATGIPGAISVQPLDLADLASVKAAAAALGELPRIDLLILNACVMASPLMRTKQGFEMQIGTNHVGHFALTTALLEKIKGQGAPARIVAVSSTAHKMGGFDLTDLNWTRRGYSSWGAYGASKLANILFVKGLAARLAGSQVSAYSLHPGVISTNLQRHMSGCLRSTFNGLFGVFMKSVPQGAATSVWAAVAPELEGASGAYLSDCAVAKPIAKAEDAKAAEGLWAATEAMIAAAGF